MSQPALAECIVCHHPTRPGLSPWHALCTMCGYESAAFAPAINQSVRHELLDEDQRATALEPLRRESFAVIVVKALQHTGHHPGKRLLDVGSAHGWFLEAAAGHFDALGIEPDRAVCKRAADQGLNVRNGYFPEALSEYELFDVIVFNDVLEHIPQIARALEEVRAHLQRDGILILNLPSSDGLFYRLSKLCKRVGVVGPFERMWQKGLPSPHLHYFNQTNLQALARRKGFVRVDSFELASVRKEGLLERIGCVGGQSALARYIKYLAIRCAIPFLNSFKSDIVVSVFRKE